MLKSTSPPAVTVVTIRFKLYDPCLKHSSSSKNANSKYTLYHIKPSQNTKVKMRDMKEHIEANHVSFIATLNWWSAKKEADITADITQQTK